MRIALLLETEERVWSLGRRSVMKGSSWIDGSAASGWTVPRQSDRQKRVDEILPWSPGRASDGHVNLRSSTYETDGLLK